MLNIPLLLTISFAGASFLALVVGFACAYSVDYRPARRLRRRAA